VYAKLALAPLYLAPIQGDLFLRPSEGVFRRHELPLRVEAFIENYLPLFKVRIASGEEIEYLSFSLVFKFFCLQYRSFF